MWHFFCPVHWLSILYTLAAKLRLIFSLHRFADKKPNRIIHRLLLKVSGVRKNQTLDLRVTNVPPCQAPLFLEQILTFAIVEVAKSFLGDGLVVDGNGAGLDPSPAALDGAVGPLNRRAQAEPENYRQENCFTQLLI